MSELWESESFNRLLADLRHESVQRKANAFPDASLHRLQREGVLRWNVPEEFGGTGLDGTQMLSVYRRLASSCLATTFVLTQRNAACARMMTSGNHVAKSKLLPALAAGELFATVGISHLTTSRQHLNRPAVQVTASSTSEDLLLSGVVPWVTGGVHADVIVTGGTLEDGRQTLAAIPVDREGVSMHPPATLMALTETATGAIGLSDVSVSPDEILHGPVDNVMKQGAGGGAGSLGTSAVAIGAAEGALQQFAVEAEKRPQLTEFLEPLQHEATKLVTELNRTAAESPQSPGAVEQLRQKANSLVIRSAQSWLAATKGAGFISGHPAERAVRESMFFLVWSCPQNVLEANLRELTCSIGAQ